jgi:hypothetical protein
MNDRTDEMLEAKIHEGLNRWAEAGEPTFDLAGALERRRRRQLTRWATAAATLLIISGAAALSFPAWAGAAADLPFIGEPIKRYLAERAGLQWAYEMGFLQGNLAELSADGVTVRVIGVIADPVQTKVFYQVIDTKPPAGPAKPIQVGTPPEPPEERAGLSITEIDAQGISAAYTSISEESPLGQFFVAEAPPLTGETARLTLELRAGEQKKEVAITASRAESSRFFKEVPLAGSQTFGPVTVTPTSLIASPVEAVVTYQVLAPSAPGGHAARGPMEQPYLLADGKKIQGRPTAAMSTGGNYARAFPRYKSKAQLVIPDLAAPMPESALWPLQEGATTTVRGAPVRIERIRRVNGRWWIDWRYPSQSSLLGLAGFTLIGTDGARYPLEPASASVGTDDQEAHMGVEVEIPPGVEPAAIEAGFVILQIHGPWRFDLPPLPAISKK